MPTTRPDLQRLGFTGFVAFRDLPAHDVPCSPGVYAVVRESTAPLSFLPASRGGHSKGQDPTVPVETLQQAWVAGVETLYLGKAGPGATGDADCANDWRSTAGSERATPWGTVEAATSGSSPTPTPCSSAG